MTIAKHGYQWIPRNCKRCQKLIEDPQLVYHSGCQTLSDSGLVRGMYKYCPHCGVML